MNFKSPARWLLSPLLPLPIAAAALALTAASVYAEENPAVPVPVPRFIDRLPDGEPVPPVPEKPQRRFRQNDILSSHTLVRNKRRFTFQEVKPIPLAPPPPAPVSEPISAAGPEEPPSANEVPRKPHRNLQLGGTAYFSKDKPGEGMTYLSLYGGADSPPVHLWANIPFLYLTGNPFAELETSGSFIDLMLMISPVDLAGRGPAARQYWQDFESGGMPSFADPAKPSYRVVEGEPTAEQRESLEALIAFYTAHREELQADYLLRQQQAAAAAIELAKNPPGKKPLIIRYWRIDHRNEASETSNPASR